MARVTVEDCVKLIPNRFELSLLAGRRAKDLLSGAPALIDKKNEKFTVTALREIGKELLDIEAVKEEFENDIKGKKVINYEYDKIKKLINIKTNEISNEKSIETDEEEIDEDEDLEEDEIDEDEDLEKNSEQEEDL